MKYIVFLLLLHGTLQAQRVPVIVITDLYHPYQDPGDNLDLVMGFALPQVELKAIVLDITDAFRKDTADHPTLWKDPRGPREAGIVPVSQLNYIFNRRVPYGIGPLQMMRSVNDKMEEDSIQQDGLDLFMHTLQQSKTKVEVLSFGSARILAVAFNRNPQLLRDKIARIHLSAGTAAPGFKKGKDQGANMIPGGEWNVALDVFAFNRVMRSGLPIALYPCAGIDGGFVKDVNNSYWQMPSMNFLTMADPRLQRYVDYAFAKKQRIDFLKAMDVSEPFVPDTAAWPKPFHFWETALWMNVAGLQLDKQASGWLVPININLREDGRFVFTKTNKSNISIYYRPDVALNERALQQFYPTLFCSFKTQ